MRGYGRHRTVNKTLHDPALSISIVQPPVILSQPAVVAIGIASIKGSLVALFFMHLRHDKFNAVVFVLGLFFLAVFLIWTLFDISTRTTVLPGNLKQPVEAFPGAPLNKPIRPSTGQPLGQQPAR
jgi:cytochrome c oxidase subunit 4